MKAPFDFVIEPKGSRYSNVKKVGESELILNTEIFNHEFVNRQAVVKATPTAYDTSIQPGDTVIVHHNVFRRWHDMKGREKNSRSYFNENTYLVKEDQIYLYKNNDDWKACKGFCFVQPIKSTDKFNVDAEQPLKGIVKYTDGSIDKGELVGFTPNSEYEFVFDKQRLYRVYSKFITIKYEYKGNEEAYNPSWA
jgi:hypothetical protein